MIYSASHAAAVQTIDLRQAKKSLNGISSNVGQPQKPWLLVMKLTAVLLLVACLQVSAKGFGQGTVTISLRDVLVTEVFKEIEKQTSFRFLYRDELVRKAGVITISMKDATVEQVLNRCFDKKPLEYKIFKETIVISEKGGNAVNGGGTGMVEEAVSLIDVTGRVLNEQGKPLEGVTVTIKNRNISTSTNANGEFFLNSVEQDAVLIFSAVNMEPFELKVSGKTELVVNLRTKVTELGNVEIVHTGYQDLPKERATGSFSKLDSANYHRRAGMNIIDRLDGTVPGVLFNKKGSTLLSPIQIRGLSTLGIENTPTSPLIVVDNFPMPELNLSNINPNDVESITVLKDAAAASIWGSKAGNGVIVITTKKGKFNQQFRLNVSSNVTIEEEPDLYYYERIANSDFIDVEKFLFDNNFYNISLNNVFTFPVVSPVVEILHKKKTGLISEAEANSQINALKNFDSRNELDKYVYRKAVRQQHFINFSGGTNTLAYQFSVGYNRNLNNVQNSKLDDQFTFNTNTSFRPIKNLEIQTGINISLANNRSTVPSQLQALFPYSRLADENGQSLAISLGHRLGYVDTVGAGQLLDWHYRPLDEIRFANNKTYTRFLVLNAGVGYQLTTWLKANLNYQYQNGNSNGRNYKSLQAWETRNLINRYTNLIESDPNLRYPIPIGGILDIINSSSIQHNIRATINVNKYIGSDHQITSLIGGEISDSKGGFGNSQRLYGYDELVGTYRSNMDYFKTYPLTYGNFPGTVETIPQFSGYSEALVNRFVSIFANAAYTFRSRYNVYASARRDGANVFGVNTNNKWKPLWSIGGSWDISKESFYSIAAMPSLRLKASYGYTGNSNNSLSGLFIINYLPALDPITSLPVSQPGRAPNKDLKWEEVRIINIGLEFQLFKERISGGIEIFNKRANDVISFVPLQPSSGVGSIALNYSSMKTNGYEITLNTRNTRGRIEWTSSLNWTHSKTTVTKLEATLGHKVDYFTNFGLNAVPGRVIYGISSYRWAGLDPANGDPQGYLKGAVSKDYTAIINDSIQNQVFHGSSLPLSFANIRNNISWKGFTLSLNIIGRFQYYFREPALTINYANNTGGTSYGIDYYKRWQKPGDELISNVPSIRYPLPPNSGDRNLFYRYSEIHVKRADNIRLQDISFSYRWNNNNKRLPIQSAQFFFYPNNLNLILWRADDSAYDPDISGGTGDGVSAPLPKTWTVGVNLSF